MNKERHFHALAPGHFQYLFRVDPVAQQNVFVKRNPLAGELDRMDVQPRALLGPLARRFWLIADGEKEMFLFGERKWFQRSKDSLLEDGFHLLGHLP